MLIHGQWIWSAGSLCESTLESPLQPPEERGGTPRVKENRRSSQEELDSQGANVRAEGVVLHVVCIH